MGSRIVSTANILVNNTAIPIVPNTFMFTEGFGDSTIRVASAGNGRTETVYSDNAENKKSKCSFELFPTALNIETTRAWQFNRNQNVIEVVDEDITRVFTNAAIITDPEKNLGADTTIALEWESDPAS